METENIFETGREALDAVEKSKDFGKSNLAKGMCIGGGLTLAAALVGKFVIVPLINIHKAKKAVEKDIKEMDEKLKKSDSENKKA